MQILNPIYPINLHSLFQRRRWRYNTFFPMVALFAITILLFSQQQSTALPAAVLKGLTVVEWESIQEQVAATQYHFAPTENSGYTAPNRTQGWTSQFNASGAYVTGGDWTWGLTLIGYG